MASLMKPMKSLTLPQGALSYFLPRVIGVANTKKLLFCGKPISVDKACEMGLIDEITPENGFERRCIEIARNLAQMPPGIVRLTKRLIKVDIEKLETCFQADSRQIRSSMTFQ